MHKKQSTKFTRTEAELHGFVSTKYESQDFDCGDNEILVNEERRRGKTFIALIIFYRILLFLGTGILTGIFGSLVDLGVHYGSQLRYTFLAHTFDEYYDTNKALLFFTWMASVFIPALLGSVIVIYIEPTAAGGGVNWVLAYLNGVDLSEVNTIKNIFVKIPSNILCCIAGLPGGKEAPLIHVGAIIGSLLPFTGWRNYRPFRNFLTNAERRDMAAAGTAAGLTSAFACPIAGIMIAFEESLSYWNVELTFLIFLCSLSAYVTVLFIMDSITLGCTDCFATQGHLFLETVNKSDHSFYLPEIFLFIFMGFLGGLLGATWNALQKRLILFRKRFVDSKWKRLLDIGFIALFVSVVQLILLFSMSNYCVRKIKSSDHGSHHNVIIPQLACDDEDEYPVMGLLLFQSQLRELQTLFTEGESAMGILPLTCFGIFYFFATCLLCGSFITHGVFVPHVLMGAIWGRLIAEIIQYLFPASKSWARPNKFAFLCGAAQLSGSIHLTFTLCVMLLEICNVASYAVPIFIVVACAKIVAALINESIYHTQVCVTGLPILSKEVPPLISGMTARHILDRPETTCLPLISSHELLRNVLLYTTHNGFPVVDSANILREGNDVTYGRLMGFIQRYQIIVILNNNLTDKDLNNEILMKNIYKELCFAAGKQPSLTERKEKNGEITLQPFMNPTPYFIHADATASQAYRLFAGLGLRHLVVVNDSHKVIGVITRRNLSIFRHHEVGCAPVSYILPLI